MPISLTVTDTRVFSASLPVEGDDLKALVEGQLQAANDGYKLTMVDTITGGHQRDPYVTGFKLTFKKG